MVRLSSGEDDMDNQHDLTDESADDEVHARREFLKKCGKYAVVVPPVMVLLMTREAHAPPACVSGADCPSSPTS